MFLKAERDFGKIFLCSTVVDFLLKAHDSNQRVCVAYCYLRSAGSMDSDSSTGDVKTALRAATWQFAQADRDSGRELRNLLSMASDRKPDLSDPDSVFRYFITVSTTSPNPVPQSIDPSV